MLSPERLGSWNIAVATTISGWLRAAPDAAEAFSPHSSGFSHDGAQLQCRRTLAVGCWWLTLEQGSLRREEWAASASPTTRTGIFFFICLYAHQKTCLLICLEGEKGRRERGRETSIVVSFKCPNWGLNP